MIQEEKLNIKDGDVYHHCKEGSESSLGEAFCAPLTVSILDDSWNPIKPNDLTLFDPLALSGMG